MSRRKLPLLLFFLCSPLALSASGEAAGETVEIAPPERLRVGLVLGGGGARGAAHIGVLKELERMQVPIDAIVGTSMGAVIGGLYASGMTPDELEALITQLDWSDPLQDTSARTNLTYRRKQDDIEFPVNFEMGLRDGRLLLPKGLVFGQKLELLMRDLTVAVAHIHDFDELPTPFRAVAADLETGDSVVLSEGDLPRALRASMSVPGIFAPVVVDGKTLVDGGLVGNVPVDAVQAMDVDVIIAVDVEFPLYTGEQLQSAVDVTAQMLTILVRQETRRQLEQLDDDDVLIRPALGNFGSTNFGGVTDTIEPGAEATKAAADRLAALAVGPEAYRRHLAERRVMRPDRGIEIDFIRIEDEGPLSARVLQERLEAEVGQRVTSAELAQDAAQLYGLDLYEQVTYRLVREDDLTGVEFSTVPKSWGPNFLQFGLSLEDDFEGSTAFNLSARLTRAGMNALGAEWRTDLQLGTQPFLYSEFYQPLDYDSRYFVAPQVRLAQSNFSAFAGDRSVARYRVSEAEGALDVGRELGRWGELRLGVFRGGGNARVTVGDPTLSNIDFQTGGVMASLGIDTLDDGQFPHEGIRLESTVTLSRPGFGADSSFDLVELNATKVWTRGRHSLQAGLEFGTTIQSDDLIQNFFPLGGFLRLSGLERGEISGPHAGLARLVWYRRSGETGGGVFEIPLYFGASLETGGVWAERSEISTRSMILNGSIFAGLDSWLGPVYLAAGFAEDGDTSLYLFLGAPSR